MKDFVIYMDTDSIFVDMERIICSHVGDKWARLPDEIKIKHIAKLSKCLQDYINSQSYTETQKKDFVSQISDFKVNFKQEALARSGLFLAKKKYGLWIIREDGNTPVDKITVKGFEIIRSDCPEIIRPMLKEILSMILKGSSDGDLIIKINKCQDELKNVAPEEIAANISANHIFKYITKDGIKKGTPWHIKGVIAYHGVIQNLGLEDKYEPLTEGDKVRVVYVKQNRFNIQAIAFHRWPKEFKDIIEVDYNKMIEKYFTRKIELLLEPMNKTKLLDKAESAFQLIFNF